MQIIKDQIIMVIMYFTVVLIQSTELNWLTVPKDDVYI